VSYQAVCVRREGSRIAGEVDPDGDVRFTVACVRDEFDLV
jgi:hypothetical protein